MSGWKDNSKYILKIGLEVLDCICGAWEDWVVCYFENDDGVWISLKFRKFLDYLSEHCSPQKDCIVNGIIVTVIM